MNVLVTGNRTKESGAIVCQSWRIGFSIIMHALGSKPLVFPHVVAMFFKQLSVGSLTGC